jgi:hypothetical protein
MNTPPPPDANPNKGDLVAEKAKSAYRWWDDLATLREEDPLWLGAAKIMARVIGIIVLLALSPFILLGLLMAFLIVL